MGGFDRMRRLFHLPLTERRVHADVEAEVNFHLESRIDELVSGGMSHDAARALAEREFGDVTDARAELARIDRHRIRRSRRLDVFDAATQELRFAIRSLAREPLFSLAVIVTLGLGIGVNAAMFGITDRLLFRAPPGVGEASDVKRIFFTQSTTFAGPVHTRATSQPDFIAFREGLREADDVAAYFNTDAQVGRGRTATKIRWSITSASLFPTLHAKPRIGRFYTEAEDQPGKGAAVVVLGHAFWRTQYGSDPAVLGQQILIGKRNYTIIGVAQRGFNGVDAEKIDVFAPLSAAGPDMLGEDWNTRNVGWLNLVVRVRPSVSLAAVNAHATAIYAPLDHIARDRPTRVTAEPIILARAPREARNTTSQTARIALWLSGLSLLVLVIACANVINLLLIRLGRRQREVGIRMALGVGRGRLISVFALESVLLAAAGALTGLIFTQWGGAVIRRLLLPDMDWSTGAVDRRVVLYTLVLLILCSVISMLAPALQSLRTDLTTALRSGVRAGVLRSRLRNALVALQAAISVILLVIAGLFVRSQLNVRNMDKGFDADHVLALNIDTDMLDIPSPRADAFFRDVADRLRHVPGVQDAAVGMTVPFWSAMWGRLKVDGVDSIPQTRDGGPYYNAVSPAYFRTVGTRIVAGRGFTDGDRSGSPKVAIVSQTMARLIWKRQNPIGRCIYFNGEKDCREVVGVAHDALRDAVEGDVMMFYVPVDQVRPSSFRAVFVRADDPAAVQPVIRRALLQLRRDMPYADMRLLADLMSPQTRQWRLGAVLFTAFGLLALGLAGLGLYSVIAYSVAQRARELSVRVALGASARNVVELVVGDAARVVTAGLLAGLVIAVYASQRTAPLLFHVTPWDRTVFVGVLLTLLAAAFIAAVIPAVRALRIAPVNALKDE
jgi:predicted permease